MFETRQQKVLPSHRFVRRQLMSLLLGMTTLAVALGIGVAGYHWVGRLTWVDSLLDASMILSGMGPVSPLPNDAAKIFASAYALFSGVIFISVMAMILSPSVHRLLHKFHVNERD